MHPGHHFESITKPTFLDILAQYPHVVPGKLNDLDKTRYGMRPTPPGKTPGAYFTKDQVVTLVEWKLSHGTFRPKLKQLVESNAEHHVVSITRSSLTGMADVSISAEQVKATLAALTALKGVGPATASLLMSVASPVHVPFFSDELFRWAFYEDAKGKGWDRSIKYTPKEYLELFEKLQQLVNRIDVSAVDAERVAYVLGKRTYGKGSNKKTEAAAQSRKRAADDTSAENVQPVPTSKKSKTTKSDSKDEPSSQSAKSVTRGTRSSTRLKAQS
ncbi:uncharacterized protein MYCFIDRAFT_135169 [Pseudocercospora fijiensis CIRAD86]|uniref:Uncharacterized protein n=1 Tax=Pseudocercospora fijiensis (strain CIRAD86) TaxID=383855 RepID=M3B4S3_PSEFD|nr:uncharacterized protein MYCFIDRAFT_135169 [Pseudocercospora fijiensis CIRAD86]EME84352.1 hypothetical protein MYCFIDRAFT_135169 [Pseudocercospora fijiensis CIRAD86]